MIQENKNKLFKIYKNINTNKEIPVSSLFDSLFAFQYKYLNTNVITNRRLSYEISQLYLSIINSIYTSIFYKSHENKTIEAVEKITNYIISISKYSNVKDIPSFTDEYKKDPSSILTRQEYLFIPINKIKELHDDG